MAALVAAALLVAPAPVDASGPCAAVDVAAAVGQASALRAVGGRCGERRFAPAGALTWNQALERMARRQAAWNVRQGRLTHDGEGGADLAQRASDAGYDWSRLAENLAHGQPTLARLMLDWMASPGHCANLLNPEVSEAALACAVAADGRPLWVMVFGRPAAGAAPTVPNAPAKSR
jgi:uncharacterized protein YkwD